MMISEVDYFLRYTEKPHTQKYKRIFYLGYRTKYPYIKSKVHIGTDRTIESEILKPLQLDRKKYGPEFPILFVWTDKDGQNRYLEATSNRVPKKADRR